MTTKISQKITPHLWFDKEAKEAAELYTSLIPNSKLTKVRTLRNIPSGDCDIVSFELSGQPFMAISAGPLFKFNPFVSFQIKCKMKDDVDAICCSLAGKHSRSCRINSLGTLFNQYPRASQQTQIGIG